MEVNEMYICNGPLKDMLRYDIVEYIGKRFKFILSASLIVEGLYVINTSSTYELRDVVIYCGDIKFTYDKYSLLYDIVEKVEELNGR